MKYFTGSRRRSRKNSSHLVSSSKQSGALETENESTNDLTVNSPETEGVQRKRSIVRDKTETDTTTVRSAKKRKSHASASRKSHRQPAKEEQTNLDESVAKINTTETRKKKQNDHEQLSVSEPDGSLSMSDERDSLILQNAGESLSDRDFLQQQIKLLKTPFLLEEDCPALAKIRANDPKHIPLEVIHNTLRKVNHKTEDEILRSLNRQAQRKVLTNLQDVRQEKCETAKATSASAEHLPERYKEIQTRVANLERAHDEIKQHHAQHKHIGVLVSQLETISEEFTSKKLIQEVKRTSTLVSSEWTVPALSSSTPSTHQELVQILFKD